MVTHSANVLNATPLQSGTVEMVNVTYILLQLKKRKQKLV